MVLGRAAPVADLSAPQRRESARVGPLEQRVPGILVEVALGPSVPPVVVVVERDAPEVLCHESLEWDDAPDQSLA